MTFPGYLALTAAELSHCQHLPEKTAWMACHYSCYGTGLSNCPSALPPGAMLIINDRTPPQGHDHQVIARQAAELVKTLDICCVLLDLQRPASPENAQLARTLVQSLDRPVAVSELYAKDLDCPVFLPPVPPNCLLTKYIAPWQDREIWLEAALSCICFTVTEEQSLTCHLLEPPGEHPNIFQNEELNCHYCMDEEKDSVRFTLWRTAEDLAAHLEKAIGLGITKVVGLYQELGKYFS